MNLTSFYKYIPTLLCVLLFVNVVVAQINDNIYISEFLASNSKNIDDEDGESSDWIEIYNPTKEVINLSGWALTDDSLDLKK